MKSALSAGVRSPREPAPACVPRNPKAGGAGPRTHLIERLRASISAIEQNPVSIPRPPAHPGTGEPGPACHPSRWTFGARPVDAALPGGRLATSGLHDIRPAAHGDGPAALAFALALAGRRLSMHGASPLLFWGFTAASAHETGAPHGPGLIRFGVDPAHVLMAEVRRARDLAWAVEEALKSRALGAVLARLPDMAVLPLRRLTLAARAGRTPCLLLLDHHAAAHGFADSRWRVTALPSAPHPFDARASGAPRWKIDLERCRGGTVPQTWQVEWSDDAYCFAMVAPMADRADAARERRVLSR
ncbi:MAG: hypothetical protein VX871_09825 [Pseudomonadota bacterium]|nr:hypothetical protein [Pseudomonadota bacterium]